MQVRTALVWMIVRRRGLLMTLLLAAVLLLAPHPTLAPFQRSLQRANLALQSDQPGAAAEELAHALTMYPDLEALRLTAVEAALQADDPDLAKALMMEAASSDPRLRCLRLRADLLEASPRQAAKRVVDLPTNCWPDPDHLTRLAAEAVLADRLEAAIILQRQVVRSRPEDPAALTELAVLTALDEPSEAVPLLRKAAELPSGQEGLTIDLLRAIDDAVAEPDRAYHFAQLGQTLARHLRWREATIAFERAVDLDPNYTEARAYLGLVLTRAGEDGRGHLEQAYEEAPEAAVPASLLGLYWIEAGEPERALRYLKEATERDPSNPAYHAQVGAALAAVGDLQGAQAAYQRAAELAADARFWSLLSEFSLRHELDIAGLAVPAARRAYVLEPSGRTADNLGYAHLLNGDLTVAERLFRQSLARDPDRAATLLHYGMWALEAERPQEARRWLVRAQELDPAGEIGRLAERTLSLLNP